MARVVYRNVNGRESVVAVHSVAAAAGGEDRRVIFLASGGDHLIDVFTADDVFATASSRGAGC